MQLEESMVLPIYEEVSPKAAEGLAGNSMVLPIYGEVSPQATEGLGWG